MHFPFESHFVQAGDLKIHFMKEGHGEPLILLHGWPQTSYEWHHQIRFLSKHFTVYALDNRGFGATEKPRIRITRDLLARDVLKFMDVLGLEDAFLAGHDWGGIIAFKVAVDAPERIRRLCLIDTSTTVWPTWAGHAFWANLHPEPLEFLAKYSDEMIAWCMAGRRPDYRDVVAPFPPDPLPGNRVKGTRSPRRPTGAERAGRTLPGGSRRCRSARWGRGRGRFRTARSCSTCSCSRW